jgi:Acyl-CoA dehydrogenase, C-terminal domain
MDADERHLFEASLRHALNRHAGVALDQALDHLGWRDALTTDVRAAVSVLFELQGSGNSSSAALSEVVACALGSADERGAAVVLPALGQSLPPGRLTDGRLRVRGLSQVSLMARPTMVVVAPVEGHDRSFDIATTDLSWRQPEGLDPRLGLVEVEATELAVGTGSPLSGGWSSAVTLAQVALAHEMVGAARRMLDLARTHALARVQFGQPIGDFQAVRHRLADTLVAIEAAQSLLEAAWRDQSAETAAMAKALAGRGARVAARHCQQVLAGVGFTTEHDFHHYVRRVFVLDQLFGAARSLTRDLGVHLLESRQLLALPPL